MVYNVIQYINEVYTKMRTKTKDTVVTTRIYLDDLSKLKKMYPGMPSADMIRTLIGQAEDSLSKDKILKYIDSRFRLYQKDLEKRLTDVLGEF